MPNDLVLTDAQQATICCHEIRRQNYITFYRLNFQEWLGIEEQS